METHKMLGGTICISMMISQNSIHMTKMANGNRYEKEEDYWCFNNSLFRNYNGQCYWVFEFL